MTPPFYTGYSYLFRFFARWPTEGTIPPSFHPVLCHMIDAAAVARALWRTGLTRRFRNRIACALGLSLPDTEKWVAFLTAVHDLGMVSPAFQQRAEGEALADLYAEFGEVSPWIPADVFHSRITAAELPALLERHLGVKASLSRTLAIMVGSHHGLFPTSWDLERLPSTALGSAPWSDARAALFKLMAHLLKMPSDQPPRRINTVTAVLLSGLITVADWISSYELFFPNAVPDPKALPALHPEQYMDRATENARRVLAFLDLDARSFGPLKARSTREGSQRAEGCPRPQGIESVVQRFSPEGLLLLEAPSDASTLDAISLLIHRLAEVTEAHGFWGAGAIDPSGTPSLSHAYVSSHPVAPNGPLGPIFSLGEAADNRAAAAAPRVKDDQSAEIAAHWFAYNKKGLLAPVGVGPVDQALFGVLQTRHFSLRLFGLSQKVLLFEQVHTYDPYRFKVLERLLEWLGAIGSPVLLMASVLPASQRSRLLQAYARGLSSVSHSRPGPVPEPRPYPGLTWISRSGSGAQSLSSEAPPERTLRLQWIDGHLPDTLAISFGWGDQLRDALARGGRAAVLCANVERAQRVYQALKLYFTPAELILFHERFLHSEQQSRERELLTRFTDGPDRHSGAAVAPFRSVLVTTPVVEGHPLLDFDLLLTDLTAPERLLDRTGLLHRHERERPPGLRRPALWIYEPPPVNSDAPGSASRTKAVDDSYILQRTALILRTRKSLRLPADLVQLVEQVHGADPPPRLRTAARRLEWKRLERLHAHGVRALEAKAHARCIPGPRGAENWLESPSAGLSESGPGDASALPSFAALRASPVSIICLLPHEAVAIQEPKPLDRAAVEWLLDRSLVFSDSRLDLRHLRPFRPPLGAPSVGFRRCYVLEMDSQGCWHDDDYIVRLDPELGLVITPLTKEIPPDELI